MKKNKGINPKGLNAILKKLNELKNVQLVVGVPASKDGGRDDSLSNVTIAAAHEFGATIEHPGRTDYGYKSEKDAKAGKSRFLKKGQGYMQTGTTGAHVIKIPERSFLRSTLKENGAVYSKKLAEQISKALKSGKSSLVVFNELGLRVRNDVIDKIQSGIEPPLSKATIRRKKSTKPLIDRGNMVQSITYEVRND